MVLPLSRPPVPLDSARLAPTVRNPLDASAQQPSPILYWAAQGGLRLRLGTQVVECAPGQGIWVPPGPAPEISPIGDGLTVPISGVELSGARHAQVIDIEDGWSDWLLQAYGDGLGYLDGDATAALVVEPMLQRGAGPASLHPPLPSTAASIRIAHRILADLRSEIRVDDYAAEAGWSTRTLQRRFETETGHRLGEWIRQARIATAADYLTAGRDPQWVAHRVGYQTQSGFSRTFAARTGVTPGQWRQAAGPDRAAAQRVTIPPLPAQGTWPRVNGAHVAVWVAKGRATLTIGPDEYRLDVGDAVVLPAGVPNTLRTDRDSLLLPIGYRIGAEHVPGTLLTPAHFDPAEHWSLVRASVAQYTGVPVTGVRSVFDAIDASARTREPTDGQRLLAALSSAVATADDGQSLAVEHWAELLDVAPAALSACVRREAGVGFAQWLRLSRMSRARLQLFRGAPVGNVARRLGYAHPPAFSRAFRSVYGSTPRECVQAG